MRPQGVQASRASRLHNACQAPAAQGLFIASTTHKQTKRPSDTWHHQPPPQPISSRFSHRNKPYIRLPGAKPRPSIFNPYSYIYSHNALTRYFGPYRLHDAIGSSAVAGELGLAIRHHFHNHAPQQLAIRLAFHQQEADQLMCDHLSGAGE